MRGRRGAAARRPHRGAFNSLRALSQSPGTECRRRRQYAQPFVVQVQAFRAGGREAVARRLQRGRVGAAVQMIERGGNAARDVHDGVASRSRGAQRTHDALGAIEVALQHRHHRASQREFREIRPAPVVHRRACARRAPRDAATFPVRHCRHRAATRRESRSRWRRDRQRRAKWRRLPPSRSASVAIQRSSAARSSNSRMIALMMPRQLCTMARVSPVSRSPA